MERRMACDVNSSLGIGNNIGLMHIEWSDTNGIITDVRVDDIKLSKYIRGGLKRFTLLHEYAHFVSFCMIPEVERYAVATGEITSIERFFESQFDTKVFDPLMEHNYELMDGLTKDGLLGGYTALSNRDPQWLRSETERVAVFYSMLYMDQMFVLETVPDVVHCFLRNANDGMYGKETRDLFVPYAGDDRSTIKMLDGNTLTVTL